MPATKFNVELKNGDVITVEADKVEIEWPATRLTKADGTIVGIWFENSVKSVYPSTAVVVKAPAPASDQA